MGREVSLDEDELDNWLDNWFVDGKRACERALELWREVAASKQERIAQLRQELDSIQDEIRLEVVARLNDESQRPGWKAIGNLLAEGDLDTFLHW